MLFTASDLHTGKSSISQRKIKNSLKPVICIPYLSTKTFEFKSFIFQQIALLILSLPSTNTGSGYQYPDGQLVVDSALAVGVHYFTPGGTVVVSLPNTTLLAPDFKIHASRKLGKLALSTDGNTEQLIGNLTQRLHSSSLWPVVVTCPADGIIKHDPTNWDTRNDDVHSSYVLVTMHHKDWQDQAVYSLREQIQNLETIPAWNSRARFVIMLLAEVTNAREVAKDVLQELWQWQIMNVVVLLPASNINSKMHIVLVYTWFPYQSPSGLCGELRDSVHINSWILDEEGGRFLKTSPLYPQKVPYNLNSCPIRASTFEFYPFVICDKRLGIGTNTSITDGLEIQLMQCIAEGMNMKLILRIPPGDERGGIQLENGTWTGLRADIVNGKADITFASLLSKLEDHLIFDDTISYFTDRFTWFVACAKPYPRWLGMARVFDPMTWLVGFLVIILASIFTRILLSFKTIRHNEVPGNYWRFSVCLSSMWAVFLGEGLPIMPCSLPLRSFFLCMIIYSLAVNTVFQTFFTSYVVNPGLLHQISNVDELVQSDLVYAFYYVLDKFFTADFLHKLEPRVQCEPFKCLDYVATQDNYATFCGRALLAYIVDELVKQEGKHEIYAFQEDSFQLHSVMLMPKGSHLLDRINVVMTHIVEAGLPNQFLKSILDARRIEAGILALQDLTDEYSALSLNHLQGSFFFLLMGLALSLGMFLFELLKICK